MDAYWENRRKLCGDLWPYDMNLLTSLEVFERFVTCSRNAELCYRNASYPSHHEEDMTKWAAWRNAADLYADELRVRLGGIGVIFQNTPKDKTP